MSNNSNRPTIHFDFRVHVKIIAGEQFVTEESLEFAEAAILARIKERLGHDVIPAPCVAFEIIKTEMRDYARTAIKQLNGN